MGNFGFKNVSKRDKIDLMEYLCYGLGDFSFCFIYGTDGSVNEAKGEISQSIAKVLHQINLVSL